MSKGKKAGIIVGSIVAVIVIVVIATRPSILPHVGPLGPTVSVDYEVTMNGYLNVTVEGPEATYEVLLFDPNDVKVGDDYILSEDMIPGHATVELRMAQSSDPIPGQYWLIVQNIGTYESKRVFEAKPVFEGPDVSITNVQFSTDYHEFHYVGSSATVNVTVNLYNDGDFPGRTSHIKFSLAGQEQLGPLWQSVPPKRAIVVEYSFGYWNLVKGETYPATVEIDDSQGAKIDSYEAQVTIQ